MQNSLVLFTLIIAIAVSGCTAPTRNTGDWTAQTVNPLSFQEGFQDETIMVEQAQALDEMMQKIVRSSTIKHAAVGAAVGCGLVVVTGSNAAGCVQAAAAGGLVGAISGNISGKRDVARRVELVSANALVLSIRKSNDKLDQVNENLPALMARQDEEVKALKELKASGSIDTKIYQMRLTAIRENRAKLAQALLLSSQQASTARDNLQEAVSQGQSGLEWHINAIDQMERQTLSARSMISLL
tara:strand:- start:2067 stop:2792 length:726 start_codon:yes stop_codon:yes gene_type:complete